MVRFSPTSGDGQASGTPFVAGDIVWLPAGSVPANGTPKVDVNCTLAESDVTATADFFDVPGVPAAYSGASTFTSKYGPFTSELAFVAPGAGQYVADLTLTQGAVSLRSCDHQQLGGCSETSQVFASSGTFALGTLNAGRQTLDLSPRDGAQARWTVVVRELPVAISGTTFGVTYARQGAVLAPSYVLSGDTAITASIANAAGQVVRTLATALKQTRGAHTLTWDGATDTGSPMPDGPYTLTINSSDPGGGSSSAQATVTLDGTAPTAALVSPTEMRPSASAVVSLSDAGSGVSAVGLSVDGNSVESVVSPGRDRLSYKPSRGWSVGRHSLAVKLKDMLGNEATRTLSMKVADNSALSKAKAAALTYETVAGRWHLTDVEWTPMKGGGRHYLDGKTDVKARCSKRIDRLTYSCSFTAYGCCRFVTRGTGRIGYDSQRRLQYRFKLVTTQVRYSGARAQHKKTVVIDRKTWKT